MSEVSKTDFIVHGLGFDRFLYRWIQGLQESYYFGVITKPVVIVTHWQQLESCFLSSDCSLETVF